MVIRAVLFDLDNTLFDHSASARAGLAAFLRYLGVERSEELEHSWLSFEQTAYDRFLAKEISFHEQRRDRIRRFLPLIGTIPPSDDSVLDALFAVYLREYEQSWTAFTDAAPALQKLRDRGAAVGIVTNGDHDQQTSKINRIALAPLVDRVFSSSQTGHAKPAPEAFLQPCRRMQISPAQTLFVGDNFLVDVEGARNAGLRAIHLERNGARSPGAIQTLAELGSLIAEGLYAPGDAAV